MNIEQANSIALPEILQKIGHIPTKQRGSDLWYLSPLRSEKTPSFKVEAIKNVWFDFGIMRGGDVVNFVRSYLDSHNESSTTVDALRWLKNMMFYPAQYTQATEKPSKAAPSLVLQSLQKLQHKGLISYLEGRGIPLSIGRKYLKEAIISNTNKGTKIYALCLPNEAEGYEIRNKLIQASVGVKGITFIRGTVVPAQEAHVFEGFMDFLSAVVIEGKPFDGDVIILNSVACLPQAFPYLQEYTYKRLHSWLDNDAAGTSAAKTLKEFADMQGYTFEAKNELYAPHKDVNQWHMHLLKAGLTPSFP